MAIQRYLHDGAPRLLVPMRLDARCVADARGESSASIVWQDLTDSGQASPTWIISDAARQSGAQAMLYASRSRPELSHVVVFRPGCLTYVGPTTSNPSD